MVNPLIGETDGDGVLSANGENPFLAEDAEAEEDDETENPFLTPDAEETETPA